MVQEAQASPDAMAVSTSDQGEKPLAAVIAAAAALAAHRPPASGMHLPVAYCHICTDLSYVI